MYKTVDAHVHVGSEKEGYLHPRLRINYGPEKLAEYCSGFTVDEHQGLNIVFMDKPGSLRHYQPDYPPDFSDYILVREAFRHYSQEVTPIEVIPGFELNIPIPPDQYQERYKTLWIKYLRYLVREPHLVIWSILWTLPILYPKGEREINISAMAEGIEPLKEMQAMLYEKMRDGVVDLDDISHVIQRQEGCYPIANWPYLHFLPTTDGLVLEGFNGTTAYADPLYNRLSQQIEGVHICGSDAKTLQGVGTSYFVIDVKQDQSLLQAIMNNEKKHHHALPKSFTVQALRVLNSFFVHLGV